MTYVRAQGTVIVSDCPGAAPMSGMGAFGEIASASSMPTVDPQTAMMMLEAQINRFLEATTPKELRAAEGVGPLAVKGTFDLPYPMLLMTIVGKRALSGAYANIPTEQREILSNMTLMLDAGYVQTHLPEIYSLLKNYADSKALIAARPLPVSPISSKSMLVIAGAVVVGFLIFGGK